MADDQDLVVVSLDEEAAADSQKGKKGRKRSEIYVVLLVLIFAAICLAKFVLWKIIQKPSGGE